MSNLTSSSCDVCKADQQRQRGAGMLAIWYPDLKGKWQVQRMCRECAVALGELQDERAQESIAVAERAGA